MASPCSASWNPRRGETHRLTLIVPLVLLLIVVLLHVSFVVARQWLLPMRVRTLVVLPTIHEWLKERWAAIRKRDGCIFPKCANVSSRKRNLSIGCPSTRAVAPGVRSAFIFALDALSDEKATGNSKANPRQFPRHAFAPDGSKSSKLSSYKVAREGIEPPTRGFSVRFGG